MILDLHHDISDVLVAVRNPQLVLLVERCRLFDHFPHGCTYKIVIDRAKLQHGPFSNENVYWSLNIWSKS